MKQQTAVEWYTEQEIKLTLDFLANKINQLDYGIKRVKLIEQAKAMEREQIVEAWNIRAKIDGVLTYTDNRTAEQYYNETYESNT